MQIVWLSHVNTVNCLSLFKTHQNFGTTKWKLTRIIQAAYWWEGSPILAKSALTRVRGNASRAGKINLADVDDTDRKQIAHQLKNYKEPCSRIKTNGKLLIAKFVHGYCVGTPLQKNRRSKKLQVGCSGICNQSQNESRAAFCPTWGSKGEIPINPPPIASNLWTQTQKKKYTYFIWLCWWRIKRLQNSTGCFWSIPSHKHSALVFSSTAVGIGMLVCLRQATLVQQRYLLCLWWWALVTCNCNC